MRFEQSFEVSAPIAVVWDLLLDLEGIAPCLPGAAITSRDDEGAYHGSFQVRLGPTTASLQGQVELASADPSAHAATLTAHGSDRRGQGGASATIVTTLAEGDGATRVHAVTELTITGRLARVGRGGMIEDVADRLMRDFAACLQTRLAAAGAAPERLAPALPAATGATPEPPAPALPPITGATPEPPAPALPPATGAAPSARRRPAPAPAAARWPAEPAAPGMTAAEAAASAGAEVRPEDSAAEGRAPAELGVPPADEGPGSPPAPGPPPVRAEPRDSPAAEPVRGLRLLLRVLGERLHRRRDG